jgi:glycosyltransferase involved in cell wall biosynthesis
MKILQVIDILNVGGAEKVFVDICNVLKENNEDVSALFLLNGGDLKKYIKITVLVHELNRKNKWSIKTMYQCSIILKQYDIIHCHVTHVYRYIKLVSLLFPLKKSKIIFHNHNGSINIDKKVPLFFNSILKPDYYIGVSKILIHWAINYLKIQTKNSFLLENIIIKEESHEDYSCVKRYDLILVSNIKKNKNQHFAIQLAKLLNSSLHLVGKVQDEDYNKVLLNHAANSTQLITFNHSLDNVQSVLGSAKLGLHTSIYETGPLVIIEYLAQGLPFLAYDSGEVAVILKPYFPEFFIDNFEISQWVERIEMLMNKKPNLVKMQEVFEKHFGKEQYFNKLISIYQCIKN